MTKSEELHLSSRDESRSAEYVGLVRAAALGDRDAMERLLMRAQEVAFRFSVLVCGHTEDAEDVMQEALLKTYQYVDRIRDPEAFRTWLYRTVRNACLMKRRRKHGEPARHVSMDYGDGGEPLDVADPARGPDALALNGWLGERLRLALLSLPPSLRIVIVLREIEGLSTREASTVVGISEDNVKTRLHRARGLLRKQLEDV